MARNRTHLPEFEPGCTVVGRGPSIDHFRVNIREVLLPIEPEAAPIVLRQLSPTYFRGGSSRHSQNVREGVLLFGGRLSVNGRPDGFTSLVLKLDLNLTRFLAYRYEQLGRPEALDGLVGHRLEALLRNPSHQDRTARHRRALDGNDNVIPDRVLRSGHSPDQVAWVQAYIDAVCRFLGDQVTAAIERARTLQSIPQPAPNALVGNQPLQVHVHPDNWSISHLEIYWEFWSDGAVAQAAEASAQVHSTANSSSMTTWRSISDRVYQASIGVSADVGARGVTGKLYAKLANRLRLEVEYRGNPKVPERISVETIQSFGPRAISSLVGLLADRAAMRAERLLQSAWSSEEGTHVGARRITSFMEALAKEAGTSALFAVILSQLLANGSARATRGHAELRDALRRLAARGYLQGVRLGISGNFTAYRPAPAYAPMVDALRRLGSATRN